MQVPVHQTILVLDGVCNAITVRPQVNPAESIASCTFLLLLFWRFGDRTYTRFTFNWTPWITNEHAARISYGVATVSIDLLQFYFRFRMHLESDATDETCEYEQTHSQRDNSHTTPDCHPFKLYCCRSGVNDWVGFFGISLSLSSLSLAHNLTLLCWFYANCKKCWLAAAAQVSWNELRILKSPRLISQHKNKSTYKWMASRNRRKN